MDGLAKALRTMAVCMALGGIIAVGEAQVGTDTQAKAAQWGQKQIKGAAKRLKIRRRHRKTQPSITSHDPATQNNGAQTNKSGGGNAGSGNGASTQSGSSSNKNNSDNNQDNSNHATQTNVSAGTVLAGLINVNVQNVNLNVYKVVDIHNVLNNSQVEVLTQKIINSPGAQAKQSVLNNLLRGAHVLNGNKIVVGVLSNMKEILTMDKPGTTSKSGGG